jgi:hypothetical protein
MKKALRHHPSAAMVVAVIALIAAVSGVAVADPGGGSGPGDGNGTHGIFKLQASAGGGSTSGRTATVLRDGPFTVTMTCTKDDAGNTMVNLSGTSSQANSIIYGNMVGPGITADLADVGGTGFAEAPALTIDLEAPRGQSNVLVGAAGVNSLGADCWANLAGGGH